MIFLSASVPKIGREFYEKSNPLYIREAIVAFTAVCMENNIPFYFGGHPAITPLVYQTACNNKEESKVGGLIQIYQSEYFKQSFPPELAYYKNIVFTPQKEDRIESVSYMREQMFEEHKGDTSMAVFIGGMEGVIDEAMRLRDQYPNVKLCPIPSTGCAAEYIYEKGNFNTDYLRKQCGGLELTWFYMSMFRKLLINATL
jgi:hypothetical protein